MIIIGDLLRQGLVILFFRVNAVLSCQQRQRGVKRLHGVFVGAALPESGLDQLLKLLVVLRILHDLVPAHAGFALRLLLAVLLLRWSGGLLLGLLLRICLAHGLRGRFPKLIRPVFADFIFRYTQLFQSLLPGVGSRFARCGSLSAAVPSGSPVGEQLQQEPFDFCHYIASDHISVVFTGHDSQ